MSMSVLEMEQAIAQLPPEKQDSIRALLRGDKEKRTHRGTSRVPADLQPYNITYVVTCQLCGMTAEQWFAMQRQSHSTVLVSLPLATKPEKSVRCERRVRCCGGCQDRLAQWSKETLVNTVLKVVKGTVV